MTKYSIPYSNKLPILGLDLLQVQIESVALNCRCSQCQHPPCRPQHLSNDRSISLFVWRMSVPAVDVLRLVALAAYIVACLATFVYPIGPSYNPLVDPAIDINNRQGLGCVLTHSLCPHYIVC